MKDQEDRRKQIEDQLNASRQAALLEYRQNSDVIRGVRVLATTHATVAKLSPLLACIPSLRRQHFLIRAAAHRLGGVDVLMCL
jgi:hypothetical protein